MLKQAKLVTAHFLTEASEESNAFKEEKKNSDIQIWNFNTLHSN